MTTLWRRNEKVTEKTNQVAHHHIEPFKRGFTGHFFNFIGKSIVRLGTRFEIRGQENLPADAPFILAPNHETYVDGLIVGMGLPSKLLKKMTCLAAKELNTDHGWLGKVMMRVGRAIPIDRKANPLTSLKICIAQLEKGNILLIHPEGTRSADGKLGKIQDGCCFISKHAKAPVVPVFIDGAYEIYSRHMHKPRFRDQSGKKRRVILTYGKPIYPEDFPNSKAMTKELSKILHDMYDHKEIPRVYENENLAYMEKLQAKLNRIEERKQKENQSAQPDA